MASMMKLSGGRAHRDKGHIKTLGGLRHLMQENHRDGWCMMHMMKVMALMMLVMLMLIILIVKIIMKKMTLMMMIMMMMMVIIIIIIKVIKKNNKKNNNDNNNHRDEDHDDCSQYIFICYQEPGADAKLPNGSNLTSGSVEVQSSLDSVLALKHPSHLVKERFRYVFFSCN